MKTVTLKIPQKLETLTEVYSSEELDNVVNNLLRFKLADY